MKHKEAYYFSHDSNARNDEKMLELRADYGYEGYGLFWAIIEVMRDSSDFKLSSEKINTLAIAVNYDAKKLTKFIEDCIKKYFLFAEKDGKYYSNRLLISMKRKETVSKKMSANAKQRYSKKDAIAEQGQSGSSALKEKKRKKNKNNIVFSILPEKLKGKVSSELWKEWYDYRDEIKKPLTESSVNKQIKFLLEQSNPSQCIDTAIMNTWQGLFEVKSNGQATYQPERKYTTEEYRNAFGQLAEDVEVSNE